MFNASRTCWDATNNGRTNFYANVWDQAHSAQSFYIEDWDGTADGFDMALPLCGYNIPVNEQPTDPRKGEMVNAFYNACSIFEYFDVEWFDLYITWNVFNAFNQASDGFIVFQLSSQDTAKDF